MGMRPMEAPWPASRRCSNSQARYTSLSCVNSERLTKAGPGPLLWVQTPLGSRFPGILHTPLGERQHLRWLAFRSLGRVLAHQSFSNPSIHGPPGRVGVAAEVGLGQVAKGDTAVNPHIRHGAVGIVCERTTARRPFGDRIPGSDRPACEPECESPECYPGVRYGPPRKWHARQDSNLRPTDSKSGALSS